MRCGLAATEGDEVEFSCPTLYISVSITTFSSSQPKSLTPDKALTMTTETATESNGASNVARPGPSHHSEIPQDARLISLIVASMGIEDMEPGVEMMLLEWAHRE